MRAEDCVVLDVVARCYTLKSNAAWEKFFSFANGLLPSFAHFRSKAEQDEFNGWFWEWFWRRDKIRFYYLELRDSVECQSCPMPQDGCPWLGGYHRKTVRCALYDYGQELQRKGLRAKKPKPSPDMEDRPVEPQKPEKPLQITNSELVDALRGRKIEGLSEAEVRASHESIERALRKVRQEHRVALWLKTYGDMGALWPEDAAWVASQKPGRSAAEVAEETAKAFRSLQGEKRTLSSKFISELLGVTPNRVDKWASRGAMELAAALLGEGIIVNGR